MRLPGGVKRAGHPRLVPQALTAVVGMPPYRLIYAAAQGQSMLVSHPGYQLLNTIAPIVRSTSFDNTASLRAHGP